MGNRRSEGFVLMEKELFIQGTSEPLQQAREYVEKKKTRLFL